MSLEFITLDEFLGSEEDIPWVIPPLCAVGSSIMLYGRQKVGKSSAVVQLMHSLTTGEPWMGFPVRKTGPVLYLQIDMPPADTRRMFQRARASGYVTGADVYAPKLMPGQSKVPFNILDTRCADALRSECERIQPVAVIVDTINDAYEAAERTDINLHIRKVHSAFRATIGDAVFVYLNHTRKAPQNMRGAAPDDEDGYLGGGGWAQVATSILELKRDNKSGQVALMLRDLRLDSYPGKILPLQKDEHGFFERPMTSQQMLMFWPECLPLAEKVAAIASVKNANDVFRDIGARTGTAWETVKKQYHRAVGVDFPWLALIASEET
jgi:RecA-family ATPase